MINQLPILCDFGEDVILCSQSIDMNLHLVKNVKSPVKTFDAVNKAYANRVKCKTAIGIIPYIVMRDHTLFTFFAAKAFASGYIIICEMWVERLADEWIATSSSMYATARPGFHKVFQRSVSFDILHWLPRQWLDSHFSPRLYRTTLISV